MCHDTTRSTSGYIVLFNNCCVISLSKKIASIGKSTTTEEFVAMSSGTHQIRWPLQGHVNLCLHHLIPMHAHNTSANFLAVNHQINVRTNHIAVDFFITQEVLQGNWFILLKVESVNNLADICTKILAKTA